MMKHKCKVIKPDNPLDKMLYETFTHILRKGYVEIGEEKICMPLPYKDIADKIENFEVRDTDIFVVTHPKAGTTWTQEMVWMIVNNMDFEGAKLNIVERFPFLEFQCILDYNELIAKNPGMYIANEANISSIDACTNYKKVPRLIKSHLPWCLLPKALREGKTNAKIIYVARNPKDVCVSYFHHGLLIEGFQGNFEQFCQLFLAGRTHSGPYWTNVLTYWENRYDRNVLYNTYEEMKRDLLSVIRKTSDFLIGRQLTDDQLKQLVDHLSFDSMKKNQSVNYEFLVESKDKIFLNNNNEQHRRFMRSGIVGSYKADMTPEIEKQFDEWINKHTNGLDINF